MLTPRLAALIEAHWSCHCGLISALWSWRHASRLRISNKQCSQKQLWFAQMLSDTLCTQSHGSDFCNVLAVSLTMHSCGWQKKRNWLLSRRQCWQQKWLASSAPTTRCNHTGCNQHELQPACVAPNMSCSHGLQPTLISTNLICNHPECQPEQQW